MGWWSGRGRGHEFSVGVPSRYRWTDSLLHPVGTREPVSRVVGCRNGNDLCRPLAVGATKNPIEECLRLRGEVTMLQARASQVLGTIDLERLFEAAGYLPSDARSGAQRRA